MSHLEEAIQHLELANTSFVKYMEEVKMQHKSEHQIDNAAHIITYLRMVYAILHNMEEA